jgi:glyoxylase-like metal-dependent hydrolase (beta-lactamase superfamily II)
MWALLVQIKHMTDRYHVERLSATVWKIVEADRFGQLPFLYVILGTDKCVLFDTGCGGGDLRALVDSRINTTRLPYLVVCSHVHFDVRHREQF